MLTLKTNLQPTAKIIHTINIFVMLTYAVWGLGQRCSPNSDFSHARKRFGAAG